MSLNIKPTTERKDTPLYANIKSVNKKWLFSQTKKQGFKNMNEYLDALLDHLRKGKRV